MQEMGTLLAKYGAGGVALIIIFVVFLMLMKWILEKNTTLQQQHNDNQVKALEKVSESNNNVAEALALIRDMFVDRTNLIDKKQESMISMLQNHCVDVRRIEATMTHMSESLSKTDERTKACLEARKYG